MGKLRLSEVQSLAQAHLVISELCDLGKVLTPQLQQSKGSDLSISLNKSTLALFHWVGKIEFYSCPSPTVLLNLVKMTLISVCPFCYNLQLIPLTRINSFTSLFIVCTGGSITKVTTTRRSYSISL